MAVHSQTGQKVALKIINRRTLQVSDMAGRVEREIQYLKLLRHPHIIKLYEVLTTPTDIIMVIEYAGGELFDYIVQRGKMSEDEARRFFQQIICALEYCHRHKIVHRDLKPENLLLDEFLNVKIADFGLSNIMTDGNFLKTSCGSPNYAAPEVISGKLYAGPEVDVWSCGVILYVMLCGRLPFDDDFIPNLFKKINGGIYTIPNFLSPGAKSLLGRMLVVDPIQRITVQEIFDSKWFKVNLPDYLASEYRRDATGIDDGSLQVDDDIVGKVALTMGYAKDDIRDSLTRSGQSEIKEAYKLVAESQQMARDAKMMDASNMQNYLAQSPPSWNSFDSQRSPPSNANNTNTNQLLRRQHPIVAASLGGVTGSSAHSPLSSSPLPPSGRMIGDASERPPSTIAILPTSLPQIHTQTMRNIDQATDDANTVQNAVQASLKDLNVSENHNTNTTSTNGNKKRAPRWHFGIRSRSPPLEVILEIYRALKHLGAVWVVPSASGPSSSSTSDDDYDDGHGDVVKGEGQGMKHRRPSTTPEEFGGKHADPFVIHCRWRWTGDGTVSSDQILVYMDIQLYQLEPNNYLVDFKCAGYERISEADGGIGLDGSGKRFKSATIVTDGDVNSAFPFLDLATRLICGKSLSLHVKRSNLSLELA